MKFKTEKVTETILTVSAEYGDYIIIADFPREIDEEGGVNAENVRELNDARPDAGTIARMMRELGDWVVRNHSDKFYKKNSAEHIIRRLEEIRCLEALSYNEIENRTGLNRGLVKRYLALEVMPSLDKACKIAEALGYKLQLIADD